MPANTLSSPPLAGSLFGGAAYGRFALLAALVGSLSACAVTPGNHTYDMREESSLKLPVRQGEEIVQANVKVKQITAGLIIDLERGTKSTANASRSGGTTAKDPYRNVEDYRLGPGDVISITVWDHPELTIPAGSFRSAEQAGNLVAEDGTIFYPYAGIIPVSGKTTREVRDILAKRLAKVIEKVQIDVRVVSYRSKRVYVVGEVAKPGLQEITDIPMTVLEAVNRAGGPTTEADHSQLLLTRGGTTYRVDLQALYEGGNISQNVLLEPGDVLNVPDRKLNKVFVLGEVQKPGSILMNKRRITLAEALADAGYIDQFTSDPRWIFVMRGQTDTPEIFHLNSKSPDALLLADRFSLQPRDIVYVDAADVVRWNRVISNILPTVTMLNSFSTVRYPLIQGR